MRTEATEKGLGDLKILISLNLIITENNTISVFLVRYWFSRYKFLKYEHMKTTIIKWDPSSDTHVSVNLSII